MPVGPSFEAGPSSQLRTFRLSQFGQETDVSIVVDSTARDAGASPTTQLRAGLVLGKITASGRYKEYDNAASDGSEVARGILVHPILLLNAQGTPVDASAVMATVGEIDTGKLLGYDAAALVDFQATTFPGLLIPRNATTP